MRGAFARITITHCYEPDKSQRYLKGSGSFTGDHPSSGTVKISDAVDNAGITLWSVTCDLTGIFSRA